MTNSVVTDLVASRGAVKYAPDRHGVTYPNAAGTCSVSHSAEAGMKIASRGRCVRTAIAD
jgi:hypothetical protein